LLIEARGKRLYVVFDAVKEKVTSGGIIVPDLSEEFIRIGTVKAKGKDVDMYKVGDRVAALYQAGTDLTFKNVDFQEDCHRIIAESNILCVIHEEGVKGVLGKSEEE